MNKAEWIQQVVKPSAELTKTLCNHPKLFLAQGVGPFAAVITDVDWEYVVIDSDHGKDAVHTMVGRMQEKNCEPVAILDYIMAKEYGNQAMREAFACVLAECLLFGLTIIGGESAAHNTALEHEASVWVVMLGLRKVPADEEQGDASPTPETVDKRSESHRGASESTSESNPKLPSDEEIRVRVNQIREKMAE